MYVTELHAQVCEQTAWTSTDEEIFIFLADLMN